VDKQKRRQRRLKIKPQGCMSRDKAWLLGFMAGDGNVSVAEDGGAHVSANCGVAEDSANMALAERVAELFRRIYDVPAHVRVQSRDPGRLPYCQPILYRRAVADDILSHGPIGTYDWTVPAEVRRDKELAGAWLSGLWDAEGNVSLDPDVSRRTVSVSSVNELGLRVVKAMVESLGIRCSWHTDDGKSERSPGCLPENKVMVCSQAAMGGFAEKIGFTHQGKAASLASLLASYSREVPNLLSHEVRELLPEILKRRAAGAPFSAIATELQFSTPEVAKGMVKRASKAAGNQCLICLERPATHSIPRVIKGRSGKYVCEPCLVSLEPAEAVPEWGDELVKQSARKVADFLDEHHYLGRRGGVSDFALRNAAGVLVFSRRPQAAGLPRDWLELSRWCLVPGGVNVGTAQWAQVKRWLLENTDASTVVSYSDPARHDGAIYRAAGWLWAPSSSFLLKNMKLSGERYPEKPYTDKNRWVYPLRRDERRAEALTVRNPWLCNSERYKFLCDWPEPTWKRGRATGGGKDYKRWKALLASR